MKYIKLVSYSLGLSFMLSSCSSESKVVNVEKNTGYFVSNFNGNMEYFCENKRQIMNDNGKFECASFPISFYMGNTKIGEISSIHEDGYVYPQDIIVLESIVPVYTSENNIRYLTIE